MERRILNVFVASPSDLSPERKVLREVADRINKVFGRRMGIQLELLGWEDTLPGFSRPQSLINSDVESCDLFIGILWKRWGTDSGKFSSGFEEEFQIARKRKIANEGLDIWIYFKQVDNEILSDPGEQLKTVIKFKKEIVEQKELLFKEFTDEQYFEKIIHDDLTAFLLNTLNNLSKESIDQPASQALVIVDSSPPDQISTPNDQLVSIYETLTEKLKLGDLSKIDFWERLRSFISAKAMFSEVHVGEVLETHDINLAYRKRYDWDFSNNESHLLQRSFLADQHSYNPGWFWINKVNVSKETFFEFFALYDKNTAVRIGAIRHLVERSYTPTAELIKQLFSSDQDQVIEYAIDLAVKCNDPSVLVILKDKASHEKDSISNKAKSAFIDLLYSHNPENSFIELADTASYPTKLYKQQLELGELKIETSLIVEKGLSASDAIRHYCAQYLEKINAIDESVAYKLLIDSFSQVRFIGFKWLVENRNKFEITDVPKYFPKPEQKEGLLGFGLGRKDVTEDEVIPILLRKLSKVSLEEQVDFYSIDGTRAYEVLCNEYGDQITDRLRQDLSNDFENLIEISKQRMISKFGEHADKIIKGFNEGLVSFMKETLKGSAFKGLLKSPLPSDIDYARNLLSHAKYGDTCTPVIQLIKMYGNESDIDHLIVKAKQLYGENKKLCVDVAIALSLSKRTFIEHLIQFEETSIAEIAAENISQLERTEKIDVSKSSLYSEHDAVRKVSAQLLTELIGKIQIEELLNQYIESGRYFYNVVKIFDEHLYKS